MKKILLLIFFLLINFLLLIPNHVSSHPLAFVVQNVHFEFHRDKVNVEYSLLMDPFVADRFYPEIDKDNSGKINDTEAENYSNEITKFFEGRFNNKDIVLRKTGYTALEKNSIFSLNDKVLVINYEVESPKILDTNSLMFRVKKFFVQEDPNGDQISFTDNIKDGDPDFARITTEFNVEVGYREFINDFKIKNFSQQTTTSSESQPNNTNHTPQNNVFKRFFDWTSTTSKNLTANIFESKRTGITFVVFSLLISFIAGSLHAITPGHGKSMMAAFLVGQKKNKVGDVITLGTSITLAHTIVIFALGFGLLFLKKTELINKVIPYFEKVSAVLLIILATSLLHKAYRSYKHYKIHQLSSATKNRLKNHIHEDIHIDEHKLNKGIKIRGKYDLFLAGLGGGIVPCPDALSLLVLSVNLGMIGFGLIMIFTFSLGLAVAIVAIGLMLVKGRHRLKLEEKYGYKAEILSPLLTGLFIFIYALKFFF